MKNAKQLIFKQSNIQFQDSTWKVGKGNVLIVEMQAKEQSGTNPLRMLFTAHATETSSAQLSQISNSEIRTQDYIRRTWGRHPLSFRFFYNVFKGEGGDFRS